MDDFTLTLADHRHVPPDATELNALLTVAAAADAATEVTPPGRAEVFVVDASGSMDIQGKMAAARRATTRAIEALPAGTRFAVIAGDAEPHMVFPRHPALAVAGTDTTRAAAEALGRVRPSGGTRISGWLGLARRVLSGDIPVRHVTLLTDGHNDERGDDLDRALAECRDVFQCDALGIGPDWSAPELIAIAEALRGEARAVTRETDLAADFRSIMDEWAARAIPRLTLRLTVSPFARLRHFRQVHPMIADLTPHAGSGAAGVADVDTGAWKPGELREYEISLTVDRAAGELGVPLRAARLDASTDGRRRAKPAAVVLERTEGEVRSDVPGPGTGRTAAEARMSRKLGDAHAAYLRRQPDRAERALGEVVALAHRTGDGNMLRRIARVAEIADPAAGKVALKGGVSVERWLELVVGGRFSRRRRQDCACGRSRPPGEERCARCRRDL